MTLAAFSSNEDAYVYPKELLPRDLSTETMSFFINFGGVLDGAPAQRHRRTGHAGACAGDRDAGRLRARALRVPRWRHAPALRHRDEGVPDRHPVDSARRHLHPVGHRRHRAGRFDRAHRAGPSVRRAHDGERLRGRVARARGGGDDARLQPREGVRARSRFRSRCPASPRRRSSSSSSPGTRSSPPRSSRSATGRCLRRCSRCSRARR